MAKKKQHRQQNIQTRRLQRIKIQDIKSSDDVAHYIHDKQYKIARNFLTRDAIESVIEFISFDLLPDQIIYQQYQQSHPSSAYKDTKDFLKRECKTLVGSMGIGVLAYPVLNLFDKIIPETGRLLSRPFLKAHSTNDKNA